MTLVQEIIAEHVGRFDVHPGEIVTCPVDRVYVQDGNSPTIARLFQSHGFTRVFDPQRIALFFDHATLAAETSIRQRTREAEAFALEFGLQVFRAGVGISHLVALEEGWFTPRSIVVGADSHTCTAGVLQCLGLGMGASDVVAAMVTGMTWLRVPETSWLDVIGTPTPVTRSKDVLLFAAAQIPQEKLVYRSVEWTGTWVDSLSTDAAATLANMAVDMGAKCVFLPPGPGRYHLTPVVVEQENERITLDITGLPPFVARPDSPAAGVPLDECAGQRIDYVFVGSCANSRLEDLEEVAAVLAHEPVHPSVHCVVTPGSQHIFLDAMRRGLIEVLVRAGAIIAPPGCGACVGTQGTIPAATDRVLTTMNRNFRGRMGCAGAHIWLASPLVAAHTAVRGEIPALRALL